MITPLAEWIVELGVQNKESKWINYLACDGGMTGAVGGWD
jgi:hypothetical protein